MVNFDQIDTENEGYIPVYENRQVGLRKVETARNATKDPDYDVQRSKGTRESIFETHRRA